MQVKNSPSIKNLLKLGGKNNNKDIFKVNIGRFTENSDELHLLERYHYLIVNTDFLRDESYDFFVNGKGYKQIIEQYGINENYMRNIIYREVTRVFEEISDDPLAVVRYRNYVEDKRERKELVERLIEQIETIIKKSNIRKTDKLKEYMLVDFGEYAGNDKYESTDIDENEYEEFVERMKYLSQPYLKKLFGMVDTNIFNYIDYLLTTPDRKLSDRDKDKKQELTDTWLFPNE